MEISISNIAWRVNEELSMAKLLPSLGVNAVEIVPARIAPTTEGYRAIWEDQDVKISSMQALLFGREDLVLFGSSKVRQKLFTYLSEIIEKAAAIGASRLVFGSPRNRRRNQQSLDRVLPIAIDFFKRLGDLARLRGVIICIEANPGEYGSDFILTTMEAAELVREVNNAGFGLHLDTGTVIMNGEDYHSLVAAHSDIIKHVHISAPFLAPIYMEKISLDELIHSLKNVNYQGFLSIEMKPLDESDNREHVCRAVEYLTDALSKASDG